MQWLIVGLVLFLGAHSTRIFAEGWRAGMLARLGEKGWKGLISVLSLAGFVLIIWGYGQARQSPVLVWTPPRGMNHLAALLTLIAFVLLAASQVPRNAIKARLRHPMVLGVKLWAFAHLLSNGTLADVILFGGFLLWAVPDFIRSRRSDRAQGVVYPEGGLGNTLVTVIVGAILWAVFAFYLHAHWVGVAPIPL